ncbi:NAD(P)/FAD-dependent oxidoreductase [Rhodococcus sp. T2V]|uniref:flavin-containing monooxygenase n=1 Tax=Rhodococcus sp. T2V TaxID=3034164 RepID=UPI0023E2C2A4|nr:NAD(P)/FAD-dependent oxidoreductase [Rhodococcus sp. T2V]MDF3312824.1 NAD(P)/FAD-dependent oxidoreductase [Rhodococcus sp. T2V]
MMDTSAADPGVKPDVDAVIVGAGFGGLYAIYRLRDRLGLSVQAFEAGSDVGGTWYWNRYPGARCDIESIHYSYSFSDELQQEWEWSERFAAQPEILNYLSHVAHRFDLRSSIRFDTRVTSMEWDDLNSVWVVGTDDGSIVRARWVFSCAGVLSLPKDPGPEFPGLASFRGETLLTGRWPHDPIDFEGKRVGVIGTASSGIQVIQEIAKSAAHLTVFQRTPNYATPLGNRPSDPERTRKVKDNYSRIRTDARNHFAGLDYFRAQPSALSVSPEERRAIFEERYGAGGFSFFLDTFQDVLFDKEANDKAADYIRERIRERVKDPKIADVLSPTDYPYATKRPPLETSYYEIFNRDDVTLVDVKTTPIVAVTERGIRTVDRAFEFDCLVLATGFDAMTGPLLSMNIVGRNGVRLRDEWRDGPRTYLGLAMHGFPNLFVIAGPQSPSALYNFPLAIEDHVDFAAEAIDHLQQRRLAVIEPTSDAQAEWVEHVNELAQCTLLPGTNSWYMGANVPGKPRCCLIYVGGAPAYRQKCAEVAAGGYGGFRLEGESANALT